MAEVMEGRLTLPGLKVTKRLGKATKARMTYLISGVNPKTSFLAYNSTIIGMERAIIERLLLIREDGEWQTPPTPLPNLFDQRLRKFTELLDGYSTRNHPLELEAFANCYHGPRKVRYLKAAAVLRDRDIRAEDAILKFFLKFETYDFIEKPNPSPRGINPRSDEYLCSLGAYLHPIEKKVYRNISKVFGYPVVMKGYNQSDRGKLIEEYWTDVDDCVGISIDASRFEQSVGVKALRWEHARYQKYYKGDAKLRKLLSWQIYNRGRASAPDGHLSYRVDGRRMSGDKNTALGNCHISSALAYAFLDSLGLSVKQYRVFCDGDDCVLFISRRYLPEVMSKLPGWYREMGFRMKVEKPAYMLEHVDFCQSRPVWTPDGYLMVRTPERALSKDSVSKKPLDTIKTYKRWIAAVGQGGLSMTGGIPCCQAFYSCLVRGSEGAQPLNNDPSLTDFFQYKVQGMNRKETEVHERTRSSFTLAFNVSPRAQRSIESYYQKLILTFDKLWSIPMPFAPVW